MINIDYESSQALIIYDGVIIPRMSYSPIALLFGALFTFGVTYVIFYYTEPYMQRILYWDPHF